jgi:hypothetical protein
MSDSTLKKAMSAADFVAAKEHLNQLSNHLSFLISLTPGERQSLFKMGDGSVAFVEDAVLAAQQHPEVIPPVFDQAGYLEANASRIQLKELLTLSEQLFSKLDDTYMQVASLCMTDSTKIYGYLQGAEKDKPGVKPTIERLSERWKKLPAKPKPVVP